MNKLFSLALIWGLGIMAYVIMALTMPAMNTIISEAALSINASANMTQQPGTLEAVQSAPVWLWAIPGLVIVVGTIITLKK